MSNFIRLFEQGPNPERLERIKYILDAAKKDLLSPDSAGYHATNLEALDLLITTGKFPGKPVNEAIVDKRGHLKGTEGELYFEPNPDALPQSFSDLKKRLEEFGLDNKTQTKRSENYAPSAAVSQNFLQLANLNIHNLDSYRLSIEVSDWDIKKLDRFQKSSFSPEYMQTILAWLDKYGISKERFIEIQGQVIEESEKSKGVVIALHKDIFSSFTPFEGEEETDMFIRCPQGLDYHFIRAIKPIGEKGEKFFENLKSQL